MQTKEFTMALDMTRALPFRPFEVVEGDTGNVLHITLQNDGAAMDLTGCGLCIVFASSAGFAIQDLTSGVSLSEGDGRIDVLLAPTAYGAGNVSADIQVYSGTDNATLITSTRFDFRCRRALISEDVIRANTAYPPLVAATAEATAATAAALAAAESIATSLGEMNVQPDWTETDTGSDAFILHKPDAFSPSAHAASHGESGSDPIPASAIGAAEAGHTHSLAFLGAAAANHTHTPASLGASVPGAELTVTLPTTAADYTTDANGGYTVSVSVQGLALTGYAYVVSPTPESRAAYNELNAYMLEPVTANTAVFHVDDVPASALTVKLLKVQVSA